MQSYKTGKWAKQILAQRREDGLWGNFHTLSCPVPGKSYPTEQAIRRLYYLGYTADDEVIQTVLRRMEQCVKGELAIDGYSEKKHDWPFFEKLMLSAWLRIFEPKNDTALEVAYQWAQVVEKAFSSGSYSREDDISAFTQWRGENLKADLRQDSVCFIMQRCLSAYCRRKQRICFWIITCQNRMECFTYMINR